MHSFKHFGLTETPPPRNSSPFCRGSNNELKNYNYIFDVWKYFKRNSEEITFVVVGLTLEAILELRQLS